MDNWFGTMCGGYYCGMFISEWVKQIVIYEDSHQLRNLCIQIGGTIGSEPEPIESRQFGKDNVNAAGVFGSGGNRRQNDTLSSTPQPPGSTVSPYPPSTEENMKYG